jgi:hypothetical protein
MSNELINSNSEFPEVASSGGEMLEQPVSDHSDHAETMPLGVGLGESDESTSFLDDEPKAGINTGAVLIVVVVMAAVGAVMGMRALSNSNNAAVASNVDVENQIETFLENNSEQASDATDGSIRESAVIDQLNTVYADRQVPLDDVKKNPFITDADGNSTTAPVVDLTTDNGQRAHERARREMQESFEQASKRVIINTVLAGSNPMASINGKIVRPGGTLKVDTVEFTVESITTDHVVIVATNAEYELNSTYTIAVKK